MSTVLQRQRSLELRIRRAKVKNISLEDIQADLEEIEEACEEVQYFEEDDASLIDALDGDDDEAFEFRMEFADLSAAVEQLSSEISEYYRNFVEDYFDRFFVGIRAGESSDDYLLYDSEYDDYESSIPFEVNMAIDSAQKGLCRMTKAQLLEAASICFRIYTHYVSLRYQYDCLKASMDILKDKNHSYLRIVRDIEKQYEAAAAADFVGSSAKEFDRLVSLMPAESWVQ